MTLAERLDALRAEQRATTTAGVRAVQDAALAWVREVSASSKRVEEGHVAPDFSLRDTKGQTVTLEALRRQGPVLVSFFRGGWCPFCNLELHAYQESLGALHELGASMVALSPDAPEHLRELAAQASLSYPLLSDTDNAVAREYGLVFEVPTALRTLYESFGLDLAERHGSKTAELPLPATYLIGPDGRVLRSFVHPDHTLRGEPSHFLDALRRREAAG